MFAIWDEKTILIPCFTLTDQFWYVGNSSSSMYKRMTSRDSMSADVEADSGGSTLALYVFLNYI